MIRAALLATLLFAGCASTGHWQNDVEHASALARDQQHDLVVYFALPGREASDRMQQSLQDPLVLDALHDGGFFAAMADGAARSDLRESLIGYGEGMGIAVLDGKGRVYAARPGPQEPAELAAFLRLCVDARAGLRSMRDRTDPITAPMDQHWLGCQFLQLGCRKEAEPLLLDAAKAGVTDAKHRLARLYALEGDVTRARQWLAAAPRTPAAQVTEGYVLFKERRHREAVNVLEAALQTGDLGDERQRALLYLGKALHEDRQDERALPLLQALAAEGTGSTFEAAAAHTLGHLRDPQHGHAH